MTHQVNNDSKDRAQLAPICDCTMHRAKWLEFDAVALVKVKARVRAPCWLLDALDSAIRRSIIDAERALLHI